MRVFVRYDMPDEKGERRRERNERFNVPSPPLIVPPAGLYLWNWYQDISMGVRRVRDGVCEPIPHTEITAWIINTRNVVYPVEYGILREMDVAFCDETNKELTAFRERENDRREQEISRNKPRRGR